MLHLLLPICMLFADQLNTTPQVSQIPQAPVPQVSPIIWKMHDECNRIRAQHGLSPLVLGVNNCNIGQRWANYMARSGVFKHGGGEQVIAMGYDSPEACMRGWFNSSGHRAWLLSSSYACGWGVQQSANGTWYWAGVFDGSPRSTGSFSRSRWRLFRRR